MSYSIYVIEFTDHNAYIGLSKDPDRRYKEHMTIHTDPVYLHIQLTRKKPFLVILEEGLDRHQAAINEVHCLKEYREIGYQLLNQREGGGLGGRSGKWTKQQCIKIASFFQTKTEFREKYWSVYITAYNRNWLDECCKHMFELKKPNGYWDIYTVVGEAQKHPDKVSFRTNTSAYTIASKMGILDKLYPKK